MSLTISTKKVWEKSQSRGVYKVCQKSSRPRCVFEKSIKTDEFTNKKKHPSVLFLSLDAFDLGIHLGH